MKQHSFNVIKCSNTKCSRYTYARAAQKTRKCPFCDRTLTVKSNTVRITADVDEARRLVQRFNTQLGLKLHGRQKGRTGFEELG